MTTPEDIMRIEQDIVLTLKTYTTRKFRSTCTIWD